MPRGNDEQRAPSSERSAQSPVANRSLSIVYALHRTEPTAHARDTRAPSDAEDSVRDMLPLSPQPLPADRNAQSSRAVPAVDHSPSVEQSNVAQTHAESNAGVAQPSTVSRMDVVPTDGSEDETSLLHEHHDIAQLEEHALHLRLGLPVDRVGEREAATREAELHKVPSHTVADSAVQQRGRPEPNTTSEPAASQQPLSQPALQRKGSHVSSASRPQAVRRRPASQSNAPRPEIHNDHAPVGMARPGSEHPAMSSTVEAESDPSRPHQHMPPPPNAHAIVPLIYEGRAKAPRAAANHDLLDEEWERLRRLPHVSYTSRHSGYTLLSPPGMATGVPPWLASVTHYSHSTSVYTIPMFQPPPMYAPPGFYSPSPYPYSYPAPTPAMTGGVSGAPPAGPPVDPRLYNPMFGAPSLAGPPMMSTTGQFQNNAFHEPQGRHSHDNQLDHAPRIPSHKSDVTGDIARRNAQSKSARAAASSSATAATSQVSEGTKGKKRQMAESPPKSPSGKRKGKKSKTKHSHSDKSSSARARIAAPNFANSPVASGPPRSVDIEEAGTWLRQVGTSEDEESQTDSSDKY